MKLNMKTRFFMYMAGIVLIVACNPMVKDLMGEENQVLSIKDSGSKMVLDLMIGSESYECPLTVLKGGSSINQAVSASFRVLTQEEIDAEYNELQGTSYRAIPEEYVEFESEINIPEKQTSKVVKVKLNPTAIYRFLKSVDGTPVVILRLISEKSQVFEEKKDLIIAPEFTPVLVYFITPRLRVPVSHESENIDAVVKLAQTGELEIPVNLEVMSQEYLDENYSSPQIQYVALDPTLYELPENIVIDSHTKELSVNVKIKSEQVHGIISKPENHDKIFVIPLILSPQSDLVELGDKHMLLICGTDGSIGPSTDNTGVYEWVVTKENLEDMTIFGTRPFGEPTIYWSLDVENGIFPKNDERGGRGVQIGAAGTQSAITLKTSSYGGTVKSIVVRAAIDWNNGSGSTADLEVYVDDEKIDSKSLSIISSDYKAKDYVFKLKEPKVSPEIKIVYRATEPQPIYLKSISILNKEFSIREFSTDEKKNNWEIKYMTFNESGPVCKEDALFDGVIGGDAFFSHVSDDWRAPAQKKFGKPFIVIDLGSKTRIAELGYSADSRTGVYSARMVKAVEFYAAPGLKSLPSALNLTDEQWAAILNKRPGQQDGAEYLAVHDYLVEEDSKINWVSLGTAMGPDSNPNDTYWNRIPYPLMDAGMETRFVKLELTPFPRFWPGTDTKTGVVDRCQITEFYLKAVESVE